MDGQKYSFKDVFSLRIRLCLLAVLLIFILGFIFSPELKKQPAGDVPPPRPPIPIVPDPDEVVNIDEKPISDLDDALDRDVTEDEELSEDEVEVEEDIPFDNDKDADVKYGTPIFIPHDVKPKPLNLDKVKFEYPRSMKMLGISGKVNLQLLVDKKGNVRNVVQMDSLHPTLDKVAVENAWKIKFSPAQQRDKPVAVWYAFWVEFKLK